MATFDFLFPDRPTSLRHLLAYLADHQPTSQLTWSNWSVEPIFGGWNSFIYRARSRDSDLAIKFTPRDDRDRAGREFESLDALYRLGLDVAPRPVLLDRHRYPLPVVVQEWLPDPVRKEPPTTYRGWQLLARHLAMVHSIKPVMVDAPLRPAVFNFSRIEAGIQEIERCWEKLPRSARDPVLQDIVERFLQRPYSEWPEAPVALCRCDNNTLNFVRRPGGWASIDWENSGWGDPAFDVADLMAHPAYLSVTPDQWSNFVNLYLERCWDPAAIQRITVYLEMMLVWWAIHFSGVADELVHGIWRPRLVERPAEWVAQVPSLYRQYRDRALAAFTNEYAIGLVERVR